MHDPECARAADFGAREFYFVKSAFEDSAAVIRAGRSPPRVARIRQAGMITIQYEPVSPPQEPTETKLQ